MTDVVFEGGVTGKALKGPICTYEFSGAISIARNISNVFDIALSVAHEMGHNLGMEHDNDECYCPNDFCIMSSSLHRIDENTQLAWSKCSINQLNLAFHHGMDHCLLNIPEKLFDSSTCGNGFLEDNEECGKVKNFNSLR